MADFERLSNCPADRMPVTGHTSYSFAHKMRAATRGGGNPDGLPGTTGTATARVRWLDVWTRAVIIPAWRRAAAVWIGVAIGAGMLFGGNGMKPADLTQLALHRPDVGAALAIIWLLVFAPTARLLVRGDGASYLRSLPGPAIAPVVLTAAALLGLQLPWAALWVLGEGVLGLGVVGIVTIAILVLARWRPPVMRARWPGWKRDGAALRAIHLRAIRRRAGDALVRGVGLSILAGGVAGLFVRNNQLVGPDAAALGSSVIAIVLVPAEVGVLLVILATHRSSAWLAASLGTTRATRIAAVVYAIAAIQVAATTIAVAVAVVVSDATIESAAWLAGTSLVVALASAMGCARVLIAGEDSPTIAARTVVGSIVVAALAVLCLGLFGEVGVGAFAATCAFTLLAVKP